MNQKTYNIPNIDIGDAYDKRFEGADIHVDTLHNLSEFFGRDMPAHRHDRFYQIHWLEKGSVDLRLNESHFQGSAPLFYFTPPAIPHSFTLDMQTSGMVLTVRREIVNRLLSGADDAAMKQRLSIPLFVELNSVAEKLSQEAKDLPPLLTLLAKEFFSDAPGRKHSLLALVNLVLINILRLSKISKRTESLDHAAIKIFTAFNELIDKHHQKQWSLEKYGMSLNITQSRLYDICRRVAGKSPKSLVFKRQIEEARWQLIYTTTAINSIAIDLGFKDPAYFCRFFTKHTGLSPMAFRQRAIKPGGGIKL